jgi:CheY-like chemotaxis protein
MTGAVGTPASPARVLAVDDRRENLLALAAILEGLPVEIISVTSGEDALKRLLSEDYAVILLDAHMPGMDGFETAGHIKQRERTRHIPILFLTAVDYDPHLAFRGYQAGAVDYITKPFDPWVLRSKVAVFVDMWTMNAELAATADEVEVLRSAVDDALVLLERSDDDAGEPARVERARARLAAARRAADGPRLSAQAAHRRAATC